MGALMDLPEKVYFRIGEVARLLEVATHVIRFWETEFKAIRPQKSSSGQRVYTRRDVERLATIKRLLREERYTIEGARRYLRDKGLDEPEAPPRVERAEVLRTALLRARERLCAAMTALEASQRRGG